MLKRYKTLSISLFLIFSFFGYAQSSFGQNFDAAQNEYLKTTYGYEIAALNQFYQKRDEIFLNCKKNNDHCIEMAVLNFYMNIEEKRDIFLLSTQAYFKTTRDTKLSDFAVSFNFLCQNDNGAREKSLEIVIGNEIFNYSIGEGFEFIINNQHFKFFKNQNKFVNENNDDINKILTAFSAKKDASLQIISRNTYQGLLIADKLNFPYDIVQKTCVY